MLLVGEVLGVVAAVLLSVLAIIVFGVCIFVACMIMLARPWDGNTGRDHKWATMAPLPVFYLACYIVRAAEYIVSLKPGTLRVAELATAYSQSQVLFALVNLGIPDLLCSGPRSAADLAANIGPAVPVEWLDRLLATAASLGMLNRIKDASATAAAAAAAQPCKLQGSEGVKRVDIEACQLGTKMHQSDVHTDKDQDAAKEQQQQPHSSGHRYLYALSGVSAVLTSQSPVNMRNLVRMYKDHYAGYQYLSEGIKSGTVPFELWSGGKTFWQHLSSSPRHAATFDGAMHDVNQIGGTAVVCAYPWRKFDCVIDVAGGVGGFLADILKRNSGLQGMVLDQPDQIDRAKKLWGTTHSALAPRAQLLAGDMFNPNTIPSPPSNGKVAYTLRNILHDWSDADSVAILRAIRSRIGPADVGRVQLLVVEVTTADEVLPCHLAHRRACDMTMLMAFGDGKERNKQQFEALFAASGFKLQRITPTCGLMLVLEAVPV